MRENLERPKERWEVTYPENCVRYVEGFRRHYWDHEGVCRLLDSFFKESCDVGTVCELGSGAGTNMMYLSQLGYQCFGYDANAESIEISRARAAETGVDIQFWHLDFTRDMPDRQFDAVVSLFVPISLRDMEELLERAISIIRPRGFFGCMLLAVQPEYRHEAQVSTQSTEYLHINGKEVMRQNFYRKRGNQIDYDGVYFIGDATGVQMAVDRDTYDLVVDNQMLRFPGHLLRHVSRQQIRGKPEQCPPMTFELLDLFQRI